MAFIECPECKKQIPDKALRCPQCGAPKVSMVSPIPKVPDLFEKRRKRRRIRIFLLFLLAIIVGVSYWFWRASTSDRVAPPSAGIFAVFRQSKTVVNERVELKPAEFISYHFGLKTDARVEVKVNAQPQHVDVMIMTKEEADRLRQTKGRLFEGEGAYVPSLSSKKVHTMDKTEILPKGEWTAFIFRASEDLLSPEKTSVNITVTVY